MKRFLILALLTGCMAPGAQDPSSSDNEASILDSTAKADGEQHCDLKRASIDAAGFEVAVHINVCSDYGSQLLELGGEVSGELAHEPVEGGASVGCSVLFGEVDVDYGMQAEGRVYRIPVDGVDTVRISVEESGRAAFDILETVQLSESASTARFSTAGTELEVPIERNPHLVQERNGGLFMAVRVRPKNICPGSDSVDYTLRAEALEKVLLFKTDALRSCCDVGRSIAQLTAPIRTPTPK